MEWGFPGAPVVKTSHSQIPTYQCSLWAAWVWYAELDGHDAIQSSHPLLPPFLPAFNLSQHQGLVK